MKNNWPWDLILPAVILAVVFFSQRASAADFTDLKFGQYQVADSQWNVNSCLNTNTCQIYSKNPGVAYKIPWTSGQINWTPGDYISFVDNSSNDPANPWLGVQYGSNGVAITNLGTGHVVNLGTDANGNAYFFFVGNDNNTGQLFSLSAGMDSTAGVTFTGTQNPDSTTLNQYANNKGSTTPLASGETATSSAPPPPPTYTSVITPAQQQRVDNWQNRNSTSPGVPGGSAIYIDQVGDNNVVNVTQSSNNNNYINYYASGNHNQTNITQSATASTGVGQHMEVSVTGNYNNITTMQAGEQGKQQFTNIVGSSNTVLINQKDSGAHYVDLSLIGNGHSVSVLQQGTGKHHSTINLINGGGASNVTVNQTGPVPQTYSIEQTCVTSTGCSVAITQGQ